MKRIVSLCLCVLLLTCFIPAATFAAEKIEVLDSSDMSIAVGSGLASSAAYSRTGTFTLRWSGANLKNTVSLPVSRDWSSGAFLEFWIYSVNQTPSTFGFGVISDNSETSCIDYYEAIIDVSAKGWSLITIPFEEMEAVHKPKGFDSVDRVELWPVYGGYSVHKDAELYFDSFFVTSLQSEAEKADVSKVVYDLSNAENIANLNIWRPANIGGREIPDGTIGSYGMWVSKKPSSSLAFGQRTDQNPSTDLTITDFTPYNVIEMEIFSENPSGDIIRFVMRSEGTTDDGSNDYYYKDFAIDWQGWKTVQIQLDSMSTAAGPRGKDQICTIEFWLFDLKDDTDLNMYIKNIIARNVDFGDIWIKPMYIKDAPEVENHFDFAAHINERFPNNQHPRLLATQAELDDMRENWSNDDFLKSVVPDFLKTCEEYMAYEDIPTKPRPTSTHVVNMALGYHLTEDADQKERLEKSIWEKMLKLSKDCTTWDPDSSELDMGDACRAVAITYDLMYNAWSEEQRTIVRNAMIRYALEPKQELLLSKNGAAHQETNWNAIINSGVGMAALAIADTPGYENAANQYLNRIHNALKILFTHYGPDGACFEGPDYYSYTMENYMLYESALYNSLGDKTLFENYSMLGIDEFGLLRMGDYIQQVHGTTLKAFNYYDGKAGVFCSSGEFFIARYTGRAEVAGMSWENKTPLMEYILQYRPRDLEGNTLDYASWRSKMPLDYHSAAEGETQVGTMRSDFGKNSDGFFVGYKGNNANVATHGRIDAGTFILENQGNRWFSIIPNEVYTKSGMFGSERYKYYRNRAEGHNTLVIGPGVHQGSNLTTGVDVIVQQGREEVLLDQTFRSIAPIEKTVSEPNASYAIVNLSGAYPETASSVKRGYALIAGRSAFLLQDEITTKGTQTVYSFMHTEAEVELQNDGKSAILTQKGKKLKVTLLTKGCEAVLSLMPAEALISSPKVDNSLNNTYQKLTIKADINGNATFALLCTPYYESQPEVGYVLDEIRPLHQWDSFLDEIPVSLTGLSLDGIPLQNFAPEKTSYMLKEDSCAMVSATAAEGVSIEITQAQNIGDTALVKATQDDRTTVYALTFTDETQKRLDSWDSYPIVGYLYSDNFEQIPLMFDGNYTSGWSNAGPQWMAFDLGSPKPLSEIKLYWNDNDKRVETFDISVSNDGVNWDKVWEGESVLSNELVAYNFDEVMARYIKVHGYYNTVNDWTSINEVRITFSGKCFDDMDGVWSQRAVEDMGKIGLVTGVADRIYSPEAALTRAEYITMLSRTFNLQSGTYSGQIADVGEKDWFMPYVEAAYKLNLIPAAMLEGGYKPNQKITREEIAALSISFYENFNDMVVGVSLDRFSDVGEISDWARPYLEKCLALRLISGMTENTFVPQGTATRGQAATILKRLYIKIS